MYQLWRFNISCLSNNCPEISPGKDMGLSCLISKPNTHEGRRDQLTCTGKEDRKCLAGKRRHILRRILYYHRLIYTELFRLGSSKETRGDKHTALTYSHLKLLAAIKARCALAFSINRFKRNATLHSPDVFHPKWMRFLQKHVWRIVDVILHVRTERQTKQMPALVRANSCLCPG